MIQDKLICISLLLQIFNTSHYDRKIIASTRQYRKAETKNMMKNIYAAFLRYEILKAQERINVDKQCYPEHQFILPSSKSYCYFHILFMYHALYFPTFIFTFYAPCFPFFLINSNRKQVLLIK